MSRRFVELSHPIAAGMTTYPGLPGPSVSDFLSRDASRQRYAPGTTFQIGRVDMVVNTGTYVDAPFHRFEGGTDIAELPLERLADIEGVVIDAADRAGRAIDGDRIAGQKLAGEAVLVSTGWERHWGAPSYFEGHPFLTRSAAEALVAAGPALVGIRFARWEAFRCGPTPCSGLDLGRSGMIRVCLAGVTGWLGRELVPAIAAASDLEL